MLLATYRELKRSRQTFLLMMENHIKQRLTGLTKNFLGTLPLLLAAAQKFFMCIHKFLSIGTVEIYRFLFRRCGAHSRFNKTRHSQTMPA